MSGVASGSIVRLRRCSTIPHAVERRVVIANCRVIAVLDED